MAIFFKLFISRGVSEAIIFAILMYVCGQVKGVNDFIFLFLIFPIGVTIVHRFLIERNRDR